MLNRKIIVVQKSAAKKGLELTFGRKGTPLAPADQKALASRDIGGALNAILADVFALYLKTKNFQWHMSGSPFQDYDPLVDGQGDQLFAMTDPIAEHVRKLGGSTLRSIGQIGRLQRVLDNEDDYVEPRAMLAELFDDNQALAKRLRELRSVCVEHHDIATASLIKDWIDESERRTWFLFDASRRGDAAGH